MDMIVPKHAGKILKRAREMRGLSQTELAKRMEVPPGYINKGERAESMTLRRFHQTLAIMDFDIKVIDLEKRRTKAAAKEGA